MALKAQDVSEPIFLLEVWLEEDHGFYDITRFSGFEDQTGNWEVTLFPDKGGQGEYCKGEAKTLKTATKHALKAYDVWKEKYDDRQKAKELHRSR